MTNEITVYDNKGTDKDGLSRQIATVTIEAMDIKSLSDMTEAFQKGIQEMNVLPERKGTVLTIKRQF